MVRLEPLARRPRRRGRRWIPSSPACPRRARRARAIGRARWTPRPTPASAAEATSRSRPSTCRPNVAGRSRYRDGDVRSTLASAAAVREGRFATSLDPPGLPRAAGLHGLARRGRRAGRRDVDPVAVRDAERGREGARASRRAPSGSSRRRSAGHSAGSGRCSTRSSPPRRSSSAGPSASPSAAGEDFAVDEPGPAVHRRRSGSARTPKASSSASRRGSSRTPAHSTRARAESLAGVLVAGPYAWPAFDIRAYGVRTNRFGVGAYRAPSGPPMALALETLIDELAADARDRPDRAPAAEHRRRGLADGRWRGVAGPRRGRGARRARGEPGLARRAANAAARARASASRSATGPAPRTRPRRRAGCRPTGACRS